MIIEEARDILQDQIDRYGEEYDTEAIEALEMAIKALEQTDVLNKIREEIKRLNPVDYGSMYSYESHNGAKYMKDDVLEIIDKYKAESDGESEEDE